MEYSNLFVILMGIGTVFFGLICIIVLVSVMSAIVRGVEKSSSGKKAAAEVKSAPQAAAVPEKVTPELVAAVSAAIAEEMGTEVSAIRIVSLKKA